ncbi:MAG: FAD-binding oxidoreductase [Flavobacteriaceae bacterium TMED206]|nr:MAG: FAD-binding oxidoreductase [Flavobacteriaceae bacterium TMED206]
MVEILKKIVGEDSVLSNGKEKSRFDHIWKTDIPTNAKAVVFPKDTGELSSIMKVCFENNQKVLVQGGLTNLVGSTKTFKDEIIISLDRMNKIEEIDEKSRTITLQSGVIVEDAINAANGKDLLLPLNFGAKGSAQIGGVVSTNAGGLRVLKYGMTRGLVLGLEAVLSNGEVISSMKKVIKDNSGYDLKQLFIGSEGTLGIVTKVIFKLEEKPESRCSALVALNNYDNVVNLLKFMEKGLSGTLTGFELMWNETYKTMLDSSENYSPLLPGTYPFYVFVESLGSNLNRDFDKLSELISEAAEKNLIEDAILVQNEREQKIIWDMREDVSVLAKKSRFDQHFDISLPIPVIDKEVQIATKKLKKLSFVEHVFTFGHVADGNIHFIIGKNNNSIENTEKINEVIYSNLKENGGSVSAEHGIGLDKKKYLYTSRSAEEIKLMKTLKEIFDPKNILNPGRVIPD